MTRRGIGRGFKAKGSVGAASDLRLGCAAISALALTLTTVALAAGPEAGPDGSVSAGAPITFNIAAQPLSDALYAYSAATGIEILVPGELLARRQSSGVVGRIVPEDALRALLSGTGLVPRNTGLSAFTLVPDTMSPAARIPRYPEYSAALQAAVTSALCRLRETRPGGYRVAARLWVDRSGAVTNVGVLGTTGDADRDAMLVGLLGHLVIGEAPPANLLQPTTVVVLPHLDKSPECRAKSTGAAP